MCWIAFDVDNPSNVYSATTEVMIDAAITSFGPDAEIAKKEFPNISEADAMAICDFVVQ